MALALLQRRRHRQVVGVGHEDQLVQLRRAAEVVVERFVLDDLVGDEVRDAVGSRTRALLEGVFGAFQPLLPLLVDRPLLLRDRAQQMLGHDWMAQQPLQEGRTERLLKLEDKCVVIGSGDARHLVRLAQRELLQADNHVLQVAHPVPP